MLLRGYLGTWSQTQLHRFDVPTMDSRMQWHIPLWIIEWYHFLPWAALRLTPLEKHLHRLGTALFGCLVNCVITVVTRCPGTCIKLCDLFGNLNQIKFQSPPKPAHYNKEMRWNSPIFWHTPRDHISRPNAMLYVRVHLLAECQLHHDAFPSLVMHGFYSIRLPNVPELISCHSVCSPLLDCVEDLMLN